MIGAVRTIEGRDKEKKERYNGYSAVRYASQKRSAMFQPHIEPIMH